MNNAISKLRNAALFGLVALFTLTLLFFNLDKRLFNVAAVLAIGFGQLGLEVALGGCGLRWPKGEACHLLDGSVPPRVKLRRCPRKEETPRARMGRDPLPVIRRGRSSSVGFWLPTGLADNQEIRFAGMPLYAEYLAARANAAAPPPAKFPRIGGQVLTASNHSAKSHLSPDLNVATPELVLAVPAFPVDPRTASE